MTWWISKQHTVAGFFSRQPDFSPGVARLSAKCADDDDQGISNTCGQHYCIYVQFSLLSIVHENNIIPPPLFWTEYTVHTFKIIFFSLFSLIIVFNNYSCGKFLPGKGNKIEGIKITVLISIWSYPFQIKIRLKKEKKIHHSKSLSSFLNPHL